MRPSDPIQHMTAMTFRRLVTAILPWLLASCAATQPNMDLAIIDPPEHWTSRDASEEVTPVDWLDDFDSPQLRALVQQALASNHDLMAAIFRVDAARARARIAGANRQPATDLQFSAARNQVRSVSGVSDNVRVGSLYRLEGSISWDADIWGRLGNIARAAAADAEAAHADLMAARLLLAGEVAQAWLAVTESSLQAALAANTVDVYERSLVIIESRYRSGIGNALEVRLARENLASAQGELAARLREQDAAMRVLEVLTGQYPAAEVVVGVSTLPAILNPVPAGLPVELLTRRADIAAAELRLLAASERAEATARNRLPGLRLTAGGGVTSNELRELLDWDNLVWSLFAGLTQPLFHGGRLSAEQTLAFAQHREIYEQYAMVVLTAFREVETALAAESHLLAQESALQRAADEASAAAHLAQSRYQQGLADIITLLEAQRRAFIAESSLLRTKRDRLDNRVTLYLALGGDFSLASGENAMTRVESTEVQQP